MEPLAAASDLPDHRRAEERDALAPAQPRPAPERVHRRAGARVLQQRPPLPRRRHRLVPRAVRGLGRRADRRRGDAGLHVLAAPPRRRRRAHRRDAARRPAHRDAAQPDRPRAVRHGAPHRRRHAPARLGARRPREADAAGEGQARDHRGRLVRREPRAVPGAVRRPPPRGAPRRRRRRPARRLRRSAAPRRRHRPTSCHPSSSACASATSNGRRRNPAGGRSPSTSGARSGSTSRTTSPCSNACSAATSRSGTRNELSCALASSFGDAAVRLAQRSRAATTSARARASSSPSIGGRSQPRPRRSTTTGGHELEVDRAAVPHRRREVEQRVVVGRRRGRRFARVVVAQAGVEVVAHRGLGRGVGRGQVEVGGEPGDRAGEIVEDVVVAHEQVARVVGGRGEEVAEPEAGGLRRTDRVAAGAERRDDLHRVADHDHGRGDRRDRPPERQEQREPRVLPRDRTRPGACRSEAVDEDLARPRAERLEADRCAPNRAGAPAAGPTRRRGTRGARRRAVAAPGSRSSPSGCRGRGAACGPGHRARRRASRAHPRRTRCRCGACPIRTRPGPAGFRAGHRCPAARSSTGGRYCGGSRERQPERSRPRDARFASRRLAVPTRK